MKNWNEDPFMRGSYSTLMAGSSASLWNRDEGDTRVKAFAKSPDNQLFFAGEHVVMRHFAYMEGAVQSGIIAAEKLLNVLHKKEDL